MLYLIGLGLNVKGISKHGLEAVKKCKKIYLENYTVDFPYAISSLVEVLGKNVSLADREKVEGLGIVDEAKKMDVALLVYGSPLTATTHITLVDEAKKMRVKSKVIFNASVIDALGETGLQIYKFGKITSMPKWEGSFTPDSFFEVVKQNQQVRAHSLILVDIGLGLKDAIFQLKESAKKHDVKIKKIILCQALGTKQSKIFYKDLEEFEGFNVKKPYCIVMPSKLHFMEREFLKNFE